MEPPDLLKRIHKAILGYRDRKHYGANEFALKAGLQKTGLKAIEGDKITAKGKIRTIDLLTLVKILNTYDELRIEIAGLIRGNTEEKSEKLTGGGKAAGLMETIKLLEERIEDLKQDKRDLQKDKEDLRKRLSDLEAGKAVAR